VDLERNRMKIMILGAGTFAPVIFCYLRERYHAKDLFFYNPTGPDSLLDRPVFHNPEQAKDIDFVVSGVGNPEIKRIMAEEIQLPGMPYVSSYAHIADVTDMTEIGEGSIVAPGCALTFDIHVGKFCTISPNTTIGHNTLIGDYSNISASCGIAGNVTIGKGCSVGMRTTIKQQISICDNTTIGMGAVVTKDIVEPGVYVGCPAKRISK